MADVPGAFLVAPGALAFFIQKTPGGVLDGKRCRSYRSARARFWANALKSGRRGRSDRRSRRSETSIKKYGRSAFCPDGAALLRRIQGFRGTSRGCRILKIFTQFFHGNSMCKTSNSMQTVLRLRVKNTDGGSVHGFVYAQE